LTNRHGEPAMELFETDSRDNYSKVVLHKQLWIPVAQDSNMTMHEPSPDLTAWCARQEAERERIRKLDHTPIPPQRPPKKACLRQTSKLLKSAEDTLGLSQEILVERRKTGQRQLFSRSASDGCVSVSKPAVARDEKHITSQTSLQIEIGESLVQRLGSKPAKKRPPVPPKPVFEKVSGKYISLNAKTVNAKSEGHKQEDSHEDNEEDQEDNLANNEKDKENIKRRTLIRSNFWQNQQLSLMDRISDNSKETLEKQRDDITSQIDANNAAGEALVVLVGERGSMSDADKLTIHIKEVESVTNLLMVLRERLTRVDMDLNIEQDLQARVELNAKKGKIEEQLEEANNLKQFRNKRQEIIKRSLKKFLDENHLLDFDNFLDNKVRLITLLREVDFKISKQPQQNVSL